MPFIESNIDIQGPMRLVDQPPPKPGDEIRASMNVASPKYFSVMGLRPVAGRLLDDRDGPSAPRTVVISEAFADRYLRGIDAIGQRMEIRVQGKPVQTEIVGVIPSLRHERLDRAARAEVMMGGVPHEIDFERARIALLQTMQQIQAESRRRV